MNSRRCPKTDLDHQRDALCRRLSNDMLRLMSQIRLLESNLDPNAIELQEALVSCLRLNTLELQTLTRLKQSANSV